MADDRSKDIYYKGMELGAQLHEGKADQVQPEYDALINRIREENIGSPGETKRLMTRLHEGMYYSDPEDVAVPKHGTDSGYYVYFGPERAVNRAISTLDKYCADHSHCDGIGVSNPLPQFTTPAAAANKSLKGRAELDSVLHELNNSLFYEKDLPTGLGARVFVEDFNRRARPIFRARQSESFHAEIHIANDP